MLRLPLVLPLAVLLAAPLVAQAAQETVVQALTCRGEEPFWALDANRRVGRFAEPGAERVMPGRLDALDWLPPGWLVWRSTGPERMVLTLRAESCASTMADTPPVSHRAILVRGERPAAAGCCSITRAYDALAAPVADPATKPAGDWARFLPDLLAGVQRCVVDGGVAVAEVATAWPMNHGLMGVRLVDPGGSRHDCIVELGSGRIDSVSAAAEPLPGEGRPVFLPARERPPSVDQGTLERVLLPSGTVAGWLHYRD
jgi:uncharacterized membrane protein